MRLKSTFKLVLWFCFLPSSFVTQNQDDCPNGFNKFFQNSCYKLFTTQIDWNDAKSKCATDEGHLVHIESEEEQGFITKWLSNNGNQNSWIGLRKPNQNGEFVWSDGTPVSYVGWADGEPDDKNNRDCARISSGKEYGWDNRGCGQPNSYICEIEEPTATTPAAPTTSPEGPTTTTPSIESETPRATTNMEGTRQQQDSLTPGAIVGVAIGVILILLAITVILIVIRLRRNTQTEQTKEEKTDVQLVNGTYDQRIEGTSNQSKQSITQPIYTNLDDNKKPNEYINSSLNISSGINESSTDANAGDVYEDVKRNEKQAVVGNDNDRETSIYYAKSSTPQITTKNSGKIELDQQYDKEHERLYYAKSDLNSEINGEPHFPKEHESNQETSDTLYYATSSLNPESNAGHRLSKAQQESCQEQSLYYAKSNGDVEQRPSNDSTTGWEENAAYSSYGNGKPCEYAGWEDNRVYSSIDKDELSSSAGGEGNSDSLYDVKNSLDSKQEAWTECALYGKSETDGADDNEEEWAGNKIYAGSD